MPSYVFVLSWIHPLANLMVRWTILFTFTLNFCVDWMKINIHFQVSNFIDEYRRSRASGSEKRKERRLRSPSARAERASASWAGGGSFGVGDRRRPGLGPGAAGRAAHGSAGQPPIPRVVGKYLRYWARSKYFSGNWNGTCSVFVWNGVYTIVIESFTLICLSVLQSETYFHFPE